MKKALKLRTNWSRKLCQLRAAAGWAQDQTAAKCMISSKQYWNWEHGLSVPRNIYKEKLADLFGVSVREIFQDYIFQEQKAERG